MKTTTTRVWRQNLLSLLEQGSHHEPRGFGTREIIGHKSVVPMARPIVMDSDRKIVPSFLFGEAWWILSGSNRVSDIKPYLRNIARYSDNGITFRGAYGPQVVTQLDYVIDTLAHDNCSRQAVLTIWNQNPRPSKDIPCTVSMQWLIRDDLLHCSVYMRSSDIWLGWVYDVFNFSMISAWIAVALRRRADLRNLQLGDLHLTAGSQHLYTLDIPAARAIGVQTRRREDTEYHDVDCDPINLAEYAHPDELLRDLKRAADGIDDISPFMAQVRR